MTRNPSRPWLPLVAFCIILVFALPRLAPPQPATFAPLSTQKTVPPDSPLEGLFLPNPAASAHSVSLLELGDGRIAASWFAGSKEGAADVRIVMATFDGRQWSEAQTLVDRDRAQADTGRLVRKLGNPILGRDIHGRTHLWFVSVGFGGWGGSALNHMQSSDDGRTWSPVQRIVTSPFLNLSTLVRGAPLPLADGGMALPVYHEFIAKHPEWLRLDAQGDVIDKTRIPDAHGLLQPGVVALDAQHAVAMLRDAGSAHRIHVSTSDDAGTHWSPATPTTLPNPNAGIALLRLTDGRLLLASNPQESNRNRLALQVSPDGGKNWSPPRLIEQGGNDDEYSYPALLQDRQGIVHLAYTWKREKIRHLRFLPQDLEVPQ